MQLREPIGICESSYLSILKDTYLVSYSKMVQYLCKFISKSDTWVRLGNFNDVQQQTDWYPILFEVDSDGNKGLLVWWGPSIGGEIQCSLVLLYKSVSIHSVHWFIIQYTCRIFAIHFCEFLNTHLASCVTMSGEKRWKPGRLVFIRHWNPQSFTMLNSRMLSDTQQTISALGLLVSAKQGGWFTIAYSVFLEVCWWWLQVTAPLSSIHENIAIIDPSDFSLWAFMTSSLAMQRSFELSPFWIVSFLQQILACFQRFPVEVQSAVSR